MQDHLKTATNETLHYRYNPQADVLAVRLAPEFEPATETPVDGIDGVSISQDGAGKTIGFRIEGVQSMILRGLIRGIFDELRPQLQGAGAVETPSALNAPDAATPSPSQVAVISRPKDAAPAEEKRKDSPAAELGDDDGGKKKKKKRKRRRRRKKRQDKSQDEPVAEAKAAPPASDERGASAAPTATSEPASAVEMAESEPETESTFIATEPTPAPTPATETAPIVAEDADTISSDADVAGGLRVGFGAASSSAPSGTPPKPKTEPEPKPKPKFQPKPKPAQMQTDASTSTNDVAPSADSSQKDATPAMMESAQDQEPEPQAPPASAEKADGLRTGWGQRPAPQRFLRKLKPGGAKKGDSSTPAAESSNNGGKAVAEDSGDAGADDAPGSPSKAGATDAAQPAGDAPSFTDAAADVGSKGEAASEGAEPTMTVQRTAGGLATGWNRPEPVEEDVPELEPIDESQLADSFTELGMHPTLLDSIGDMGFSVPTPIQAAAIPAAMQGRDVVGLAQTGTGKTLAFVAPGLHRMLEDSDKRHRARVLVLAPTRELTVQVAQEAERIAARSDLRVATIYGGVAMGPQIDALKRGADLIVATPGRMLDHLRRGNATMGEVKTLVLDEADRMLDMGFLPDVRTIMRFLPADRQTLLFTATMPPEIESLSLEFQNKPEMVEIARRKPPSSIDQRLYPVGKHLKVPLLVHLLKNEPEVDRVLIFTERKIDADNLGARLKQEGIDCALMHGDRRQSDREKALRRLRDRSVRVLVATNVAARGLDIEGISHVINFDIPQTVDEYVHRIGRTARADATGKAYSLVTMGDEIMVTRIESALERELPRHEAEGFDYDVPAPSWAKPSPKDVIAMLGKEQSRSDRLRGLGRRR